MGGRCGILMSTQSADSHEANREPCGLNDVHTACHITDTRNCIRRTRAAPRPTSTRPPYTAMVVSFVTQNQWNDAKGPMNVDKPSPVLATKGDQDPQWLKDLQRDGVSGAAWTPLMHLLPSTCAYHTTTCHLPITYLSPAVPWGSLRSPRA